MHSNVAVLKLKSNESESAKKKCRFLDHFFLNRSLKLVHLRLFLPSLQYSYEVRFTMSKHLCIHCSQSFTLEHQLVGILFERYTNREVTKGIFQALYWKDQLLLNISVANVKLDFETYYKVQTMAQNIKLKFCLNPQMTGR